MRCLAHAYPPCPPQEEIVIDDIGALELPHEGRLRLDFVSYHPAPPKAAPPPRQILQMLEGYLASPDLAAEPPRKVRH